MKVSYTELNDILLKVFEGLQFSRGDYEDLARAICWLEFRDYPILEKSLRVAQLPQIKQPRISFEDSHSATISVEKCIGFMASALALNLAYVKSKALEGTAVEVSLLNPTLPTLLIPNLSLISQRGYAAQLVWHEERECIYQVKIEPMALHPQLTTYMGEDLPINWAVHIEVGKALNHYSPPLGILDVQLTTPDELQDRFNQKIINGLELDDSMWDKLKQLAQNVLVESSDESRNRGAGEDA